MAKKEVEKEKGVSPQDRLQAYLNETKAEHYNFEETVSYKVSSGSLTLDSVLNGGFGPGLIRLVGFNQAGKTPEAFEICRNFLKTVPNSRAIYIKAEGRLSQDTIERSGLTFVSGSTEDWVNGTCYIHESNIYENILGLIQGQIENNPEHIRYCFILDSVDGVILKQDKLKNLEESNKVAGPQVVSKKFLQQSALPLFKFGHLTIFISQVSADVKIDPYAAGVPRTISATGGNALLHWSDYIIDYAPQFPGDLILEDPKKKPDRIQNKILGHQCKVEIKKSSNETKGLRLTYPIKHGRKNGSSIWRELEVCDFMLAKELLIKSGAWFNFEDSMLAEMRKIQPETPDKFQGIKNVQDYLENNEPVTTYLYNLACSFLAAESPVVEFDNVPDKT